MRAPAPIAETALPLTVAARPEETGGRRIGVLVSHGFTGSPASMRPWAEALAERGYAVSLPRLPGHGTHWRDLNRTEWADWYAEIGRVFDRLRAENDAVVAGWGSTSPASRDIDGAAFPATIAGAHAAAITAQPTSTPTPVPART